MNEVWKDIREFEGKYQISNLGSVRHAIKRKRMSPGCSMGYLLIGLRYKNKTYSSSIHRLVATEFIDNPDNKPCVNHKDGNKHNNLVSNLEWVTHAENTSHYLSVLKPNKKQYNNRKYPKHIGREILQLSTRGEIIKEYPSYIVASKETGIPSRDIWRAIQNIFDKAGKYKWRYKNIVNN